MTGFTLFGSILAILITVIIWAAIRSASDTGAELEPEERRDAAIEALRELEFEYGTGKLSDEEYLAIRRRLEREALAARDEVTVDACPRCGLDRAGTDVFCTGCGHRF